MAAAATRTRGARLGQAKYFSQPMVNGTSVCAWPHKAAIGWSLPDGPFCGITTFDRSRSASGTDLAESVIKAFLRTSETTHSVGSPQETHPEKLSPQLRHAKCVVQPLACIIRVGP